MVYLVCLVMRKDKNENDSCVKILRRERKRTKIVVKNNGNGIPLSSSKPIKMEV